MQSSWKKQREKKAFLALSDGTLLPAWSFGAPVDRLGEVVFNTSMTGYQEILTDPSYTGQVVALTYPEIGNTGWNPDDCESERIHAEGLLVSNINVPSNWRSMQSLSDALQTAGVPALAGLDTRALTLRLRTRGTLKGFLCASGAVSPEEGVARARQWPGLDGLNSVAGVSTSTVYDWDRTDRQSAFWDDPAHPLPAADRTIVAIDCGIKWNILRCLRQEGMRVRVVPASTPADTILALKPDGVFLSNGPGDPAGVTETIDTIRRLLGKVPLMGICLGHQLLGTALGGRTARLKFGHHGANHPVLDRQTGRVEITAQNHNFTVLPESLPADRVEITHINLNDNTVEGLRHRRLPAFSVQYHPEAGPGPHDARPLFQRFRSLIDEA